MKYEDFRKDYAYRCTKGNDTFSVGDIITISSDDGGCNVFCQLGGWYDEEDCTDKLFSGAEFEPARDIASNDNGRHIIGIEFLDKYVRWEVV